MTVTPAIPRYRGRFAPTPSGPLHLGSLLTALASWLCARTADGDWLLRIDDLDPDRCRQEHTAAILRQLEAHGLNWTGEPRYQSQHLYEYREAIRSLREDGRVYACACSRATLQQNSAPHADGPVYDGRCRTLDLPSEGQALRLRVPPGDQMINDPWQGLQSRDATTEVGDFVLQRRDGVPGYQLACAVDEVAQQITEVVRGADLLGSTFRQLQVLDALGHPPPAYRHLPVLVTANGLKLSKQNHAPALDTASPGRSLWQCLLWLGQCPPVTLSNARATEVLDWSLAHWKPTQVPCSTCIKVEQRP